jgi:hydrogenase maturation protease
MTALVVALGHPDRGDDAIGGLVAEHLRADPPPDCTIAVVGNPLDLLDVWGAADPVVVVDAVTGADEPGSICVLEGAALTSVRTASGSHDLGLGDVVAMAEALRRRPARLTVVGIQGARFDIGAPVSPGVLDAVPQAAAIVRSLLGPPHRSAGGFGL